VGGGATRLLEEEPTGLVKWRAGELGPGGAGRAAKRQLVTGENASGGQWVALQENREGEAGGRRRRSIRKFWKSSRSFL
jgi:hypothetical protein